uniref:Uncharacterized protein AlNc14C361G10991 n=1 Tax=Albugo laibachii Nc14 TaxID=890382 RepID=F0WXQ5_9STRA|nr:conserved hypothetical protein [Albugo laibachii Nc14]|eukprot:CCA26251.1 conserved hypothetical protein [Albugo laibachii Nc14]
MASKPGKKPTQIDRSVGTDKYWETNPQRGRYIPSDSTFFQTLSEAYDNNASEVVIRSLALREVAKSAVDPSFKVELFIPAPKLTTIFGLEDVLASLHRENQTDVWTTSLPHVCDFVFVRGRRIKFHCNDREIAITLGGSSVRCLGKKPQIQPYRQYGEWYYIDLRNVSIGVGDVEIFDHFERFNVHFGTAPYVHQGPLQSRDHAIWSRSKQAPAASFSSTDQQLREIFFLVAKQTSMKAQYTRVDLDEAELAAKQANDTTAKEAVKLLRPLSVASYEEWTDVSNKIVCKKLPVIPEATTISCTEIQRENCGSFI